MSGMMDKKLMIKFKGERHYKSLLSELTMKDLTVIRKSMKIVGASSLKKNDLIDVIVKESAAAAKVLLEENSDAKSLYVRLAANEGMKKLEDADCEASLQLKDMGMAFPAVTAEGEEMLILPVELEGMFTECTSSEDAENKMATIARGLLYHYGVLEVNTLHRMAKEVDETVGEKEEFEQVLLNYMEDHKDIKADGSFYCHGTVEQPSKIREKVVSRPYLPYCDFKPEQIFEAAKPGYRRPYGEYEVMLMRKLEGSYQLSEDVSKEILENIIDSIRNDKDLHEIITCFNQYIKFPNYQEANRFLSLIQLINNNMPLWIFKGYTPARVSELEKTMSVIAADTVKKKKIGRNEICPCGSGKKYKHCCGK